MLLSENMELPTTKLTDKLAVLIVSNQLQTIFFPTAITTVSTPTTTSATATTAANNDKTLAHLRGLLWYI